MKSGLGIFQFSLSAQSLQRQGTTGAGMENENAIHPLHPLTTFYPPLVKIFFLQFQVITQVPPGSTPLE
jgi:hypothetical protein